jgi:hypothetical protein
MKAAERALARVSTADAEPAGQALYEEYVRGFDEIPVLEDAVRIPPRRTLPPNFVRGERRDLRKQERSDGYLQREASLAETEWLYREYVVPTAGDAKRKPARAKKKSGGSKRKRKADAA